MILVSADGEGHVKPIRVACDMLASVKIVIKANRNIFHGFEMFNPVISLSLKSSGGETILRILTYWLQVEIESKRDHWFSRAEAGLRHVGHKLDPRSRVAAY
jgi:hypothetical protein